MVFILVWQVAEIAPGVWFAREKQGGRRGNEKVEGYTGREITGTRTEVEAELHAFHTARAGGPAADALLLDAGPPTSEIWW